jgi:RNA polymerase sigma-54 factor
MNENPAGKEEDEYEKDEFESEDYDDYDDSESDRVEAEDINIDEYLSDDDTPDYKTQTNNYSDDEERESPLAAPSFIRSHQSVEYVYPE